MSLLNKILSLYYRNIRLFSYLAPALDLGLRLHIANIFFKSGLTKIKTWDSTLYLFSEEYRVPYIPSELAAWMATAGELVLPALLVLGLFGRFAALGLSIVNGIAVIAYAHGLSEAGLNQHFYWGLILAILLVHGNGKWAIDTLIERRIQSTGR